MTEGVGTGVLVVEDDSETRAYLAGALGAPGSGRVVRTAATLAEGLSEFARATPDVILVDIGLPDGSGVDLIRHAREQAPSTISMVITVFGDEASIIRALEAGARGYLLKSEAPDDLRNSVDQLLAGGSPISPAIASHLLKRFDGSNAPDAVESHAASLTRREREALELMVKGLSYQEVAEALGITRNTATTHIRSIYRKLEVKSKSEAVYEAITQGLVKIEGRS
jgi:DNA-binding NarL/FixJ family response regulator